MIASASQSWLRMAVRFALSDAQRRPDDRWLGFGALECRFITAETDWEKAALQRTCHGEWLVRTLDATFSSAALSSCRRARGVASLPSGPCVG